MRCALERMTPRLCPHHFLLPLTLLAEHHWRIIILSQLFSYSQNLAPLICMGGWLLWGVGWVWEDLSPPTFSPPLQEHNVPTNDVVPINLLTSSPHPPHHNTITHPHTALHWQDSHTGASVLHSSLYCIMLCCHMDS